MDSGARVLVLRTRTSTRTVFSARLYDAATAPSRQESSCLVSQSPLLFHLYSSSPVDEIHPIPTPLIQAHLPSDTDTMAPCPMLHEGRAYLDPFWSAALHIATIFIFGAFVYLVRKSRSEPDELKDLGRQQTDSDPGKQHKQIWPTDEKRACQTSAPAPVFFLVGDSTTAVQAEDGGGWGSGFLSVLIHGAKGTKLWPQRCHHTRLCEFGLVGRGT